MSRKKVGVIFGGRSVEHEISVVTAHQVLAAMPPEFEAIPLYISKQGQWFCGDALRDLQGFWNLDNLLRKATPCAPVADTADGQMWFAESSRGLLGKSARRFAIDVAFPVVHGHGGEDGSLQGLFDLLGVAYAGPTLLSAAICMDKLLTKEVLRANGVGVLEHLQVDRTGFASNLAGIAAEAEAKFTYPMFVKPRSLGSSIGVSPAGNRNELQQGLELALSFDARALVEPSLPGIVEVNCAVLGDYRGAKASTCEQLNKTGFVSYEDKYAGGKGKSQGMKSADRIIPAPIADALTAAIQASAVQAFTAVGGAGVARIDFLVNPDSGTFYVNEINSVPGSLAFYLWEPAGIGFAELLAKLIEIAVNRHHAERESIRSFDRWILSRPAAKA